MGSPIQQTNHVEIILPEIIIRDLEIATGQRNLIKQITFKSVDLGGNLPAVEGLTLPGTPRTTGWVLETGFGAVGATLGLGGSLLLLVANVASVKTNTMLS